MGNLKEIKPLLGRLKGIARTCASVKTTDYVETFVVQDYNGVITELAKATQDNLDFLLIPNTQATDMGYGQYKYKGIIFKSKLEQAISFLEASSDLGEEVIQVGSLIKAISDSQLRDRCIDLLQADANFDRVFREATTVLEDRMRTLSGLDDKYFGVKLVDTALNLTNGVLELPGGQKEKEGLLLIFKGVMLAFRDETHHKIIDDATRADAIKLLSLIDILLQVLTTAQKRA
ncbi:MAG: hypothetical protein A2142_03510 [candidate division Zixibacteria bacterium RBG_16_48_11]|nr:MAG: hypothetical protein A2142_03510 [candidate division Zixibacteria bacterium RBG_16_48_11]